MLGYHSEISVNVIYIVPVLGNVLQKLKSERLVALKVTVRYLLKLHKCHLLTIVDRLFYGIKRVDEVSHTNEARKHPIVFCAALFDIGLVFDAVTDKAGEKRQHRAFGSCTS